MNNRVRHFPATTKPTPNSKIFIRKQSLLPYKNILNNYTDKRLKIWPENWFKTPTLYTEFEQTVQALKHISYVNIQTRIRIINTVITLESIKNQRIIKTQLDENKRRTQVQFVINSRGLWIYSESIRNKLSFSAKNTLFAIRFSFQSITSPSPLKP